MAAITSARRHKDFVSGQSRISDARRTIANKPSGVICDALESRLPYRDGLAAVHSRRICFSARATRSRFAPDVSLEDVAGQHVGVAAETSSSTV
jgi:hypothetical protein